MAPVEVDDSNKHLVRARLYPLKPKSYKWKYDVGDRVRITMRRQPFKKGYLGRWSEEIFEIDARLPTVPVTYRLKDLAGDTIKGKFYKLDGLLSRKHCRSIHNETAYQQRSGWRMGSWTERDIRPFARTRRD